MSSDPDEPIRVLMVCTGNICRSPTAEAMLRKLAREAGLAHRIEVDSAGTTDYHVDAPPDRRAILHGERRGLALRQLRGRQVEALDFERFDLIFGMDDDHVERLKHLRPPGARARIALLLENAPALGEREVPDPYYGGDAAFERVLDLVEAGCRGLLASVSTPTAADPLADVRVSS